MRSLSTVFALTVMVFAGGCYSKYAVSPEHLKGCRYAEGGGEIVEHYCNQNYGWYLFDKYPLVCGNTNPKIEFFFLVFSDEVRADVLMKLFNDHVRKTGLRAKGVTITKNDTVTFEIPFLSIPCVIPYLICYRDIQISGVLVKPGTEDADRLRREEVGR